MLKNLSNKWNAMDKDTQAKYLRIYVGIFMYILFIFIVIHTLLVMQEDPTLDLVGGVTAGIDDLLERPFQIFPLPSGLFQALALWTLIIAAVIFFFVQSQQGRKHYDPNTVSGSAQWMKKLDEYNKKYTEPFGKVTHESMNNMILSRDLALSMNARKIRRNMNVFVIGGSGAGKTFNFVGPNLMQANCSYVITDPSGELYEGYGHFFEYLGYKVKCFNLSHMEKGNHYNPFHYIHSDADIEILVTTLISNTTPPNKQGGDPFWEKSETALLVALIAYLYHYVAEKDQNFQNVMKLMRLADINENDSSSKSPLDYIFEGIEKEEPDSFAVTQYKTFKMGAGKTLKGILISCAVRLQAFDLSDVANLTNTDNIDLDYIGDEPTALFVILPTADKTFNFLASMMYSQLFQRVYDYCENTATYSQLIVDGDGKVVKTFRASNETESEQMKEFSEGLMERIQSAEIMENKDFNWWEIRTQEGEFITYRGTKEKAEEALATLKKGHAMPNAKQGGSGRRLPIHTRLILDEFANIGKIPDFQEKVATIRKYEISVTIILQSLQQMKNAYEKEWESISGNCDNTVYLGGGADTVTAEWISKLLGKETRIVLNTSYSNRTGSSSYNRQGVELFAPDQIRTMPEDECIVIPKSMYAYKGKKYTVPEHPNRKLVDDLHDERGGYIYSDKKCLYIQKMTEQSFQKQNEVHEADVSDNHGEAVAPDSAESNELEREEQEKQQRAKEIQENRDNNGNTVVDAPTSVESPDNRFAKSLNNNTEEAAKERMDSAIDLNNEEWGLNELEFGSGDGDHMADN